MSLILLLFPLVTDIVRKVQFAVPLIPNHLFPFVRLMAHWSGPGLRTDRTKILSLRLCNYVLRAPHYCFAHIIRRIGSITMQKSLRQQRKLILWKNYINEEDGVKLHLESKKTVSLNIPRNLWQIQCQKLSLLFLPCMLWIFIALKTIQ